MEIYNYYNEVKKSVLDFMEENDYTTENKNSDELYDECFISDDVTGNASGSFFCNTFKAEEAVCHNWALIGDAWNEFCLDAKELSRGADYIDVTLRCYVLGSVISEIYEK